MTALPFKYGPAIHKITPDEYRELTITHRELCNRAEKWLQSTGCSVTASEIASGCFQRPDAIGFKNYGQDTLLVECKTSCSDFFADRKKYHQQGPEKSIGMYRWYLTPAGLVEVDELPDGWGLLELSGNRIKVVKGSLTPTKTTWDDKAKTIVTTWKHPAGRACQFDHRNFKGEQAILFSIARRLNKGN